MDFVTPGGTTKLDAALQGKHTPGLKKLMHELRVMKSGEEAAVMRKAGKMSGRAFTKAMGEDFVDEKELANFLDYNFKMNGCDGSAYVPVVGGGVVSQHLNVGGPVLKVTECPLDSLHKQQRDPQRWRDGPC